MFLFFMFVMASQLVYAWCVAILKFEMLTKFHSLEYVCSTRHALGGKKKAVILHGLIQCIFELNATHVLMVLIVNIA